MSIRKYWLFAFVLIILITSVNLISPRTRKHSMNVRVSSRGIPEHGLLLIGPTDLSFKENLSAALGESSDEISETAKLLSAVVMNSSQHSVVAYHLSWKLVDVDGKTVSHERSYKDPTSLMEHRRTQGQRSEGDSIGPGSSRLLSLVPFLTDMRHPQGSIGGGVLERADTTDTDSVIRALQVRNTKELASRFAENLDRIVSITASLDGAFFDDGTFVGPDESQFFSKLKAQVDARYDLYERIQSMFSSKKASQKILQYVANFANMPRVHLGHDSFPNQFYDFYKRFYAQEISRIWSISGPESASRFVMTAISEPWASLKKL